MVGAAERGENKGEVEKESLRGGKNVCAELLAALPLPHSRFLSTVH